MHRVLRVLWLLLLPTAPLAAQIVNGSVVLSDSVTPVPGVIVIATDVNGIAVGRALTTARGTFTIPLSAPGTVALKVLRIGYQPSSGPTLVVATGATASARIVFAARPVTLAAVNVRERETCRVRSDSSLVVAHLWEEARKAMLTTQLSGEAAPLLAEWIEYDRTLDTTAHLVRQQRVRSAQHLTTHAFRSQPADVLASAGYVVSDSGGTTYYAPDAEVLLSDVFVLGHCFRLETAVRDANPRLAGVSFSPSRDRRDNRDIEGTLWVDRATSELRYLEYRYTNIPDVAAAANAGGRVEFLRLPDGSWLVSRWHIQMPQLAMRDRTTEAGRRLIMSRTPQVLRAVRITGGEVLRAARNDSLLYQAVGAGITVQLLSRDSLVPAAGATVQLDGTDYSARANVLGLASITPVLPGRYRVRARTALMDSVGMPAVEREVEAHEGTRVDSLTLPGAEDVLAATCPRDSIQTGEGMLHGRVRDERARAVSDAAVVITWNGAFSIVKTGDSDRLSYSQKRLGALTDASGYWRVCGVPREIALVVHVASDSGSDARDARLNDLPFANVELVLHRQAPAVSREISVANRLAVRSTALVELAVTDARGSPLADASLEVMPAGATARTLLTGPTGRVLLPDVVPGVLAVRARHVGFIPGEVSAVVVAGRNTLPIVLSAVAAPMLDTVRVVGARTVLGMQRNDEVEMRRRLKLATVSITREEIEKRNPTAIWQMLTNVPSIKLTDGFTKAQPGDYKVVATSTRTFMADFSGEPCYLMVMVDGIPKNNGAGKKDFDMRELPPPDQIHAVEVFAGASSIPVQYSGTGDGKWCGMIAVWTR